MAITGELLTTLAYELSCFPDGALWVDTLKGIIAGLPGGEDLEDAGVDPVPMGWHEFDVLVLVLKKIDGIEDVERLAKFFLGEIDVGV